MVELLKNLIDTKYEHRSFSYFIEYNENEGRYQALEDYALLTDNFKIK